MTKEEIQERLVKALQTSPIRGHVRRVSVFGSHLHGTARETSDIDLLIEFNCPISMLKFVRMERDLGNALGKKVDLCTKNSLSKYFRDDVVQEAETLYEAIT